jgi:hypothetical protein
MVARQARDGLLGQQLEAASAAEGEVLRLLAAGNVLCNGALQRRHCDRIWWHKGDVVAQHIGHLLFGIEDAANH